MARRKDFTGNYLRSRQTGGPEGWGLEARGGKEMTKSRQNRPGRAQSSNQVVFQGLPCVVSQDEMVQFFRSIGNIKRKKVIFCKYKFESEATVIYEDPIAAQSAVHLFNGKEIWAGFPMRITLAMVTQHVGDGREPFESREGFHRVGEQEEVLYTRPAGTSQGQKRQERRMWR